MKEEFEENLPGAGGRTRRSEPIPLSPPYHPCNDHSANEEDGVASSKWLQSCRRDKMRTVGCPRHGLSRGGGHEFSSNINFRIYYNLALFFFKSETSAASKKSRTRVIFNRITANWLFSKQRNRLIRSSRRTALRTDSVPDLFFTVSLVAGTIPGTKPLLWELTVAPDLY